MKIKFKSKEPVQPKWVEGYEVWKDSQTGGYYLVAVEYDITNIGSPRKCRRVSDLSTDETAALTIGNLKSIEENKIFFNYWKEKHNA